MRALATRPLGTSRFETQTLLRLDITAAAVLQEGQDGEADRLGADWGPREP